MIEKLKNEMIEIETRWFAFLEKLEERLDELAEASIVELKDVYDNDDDLHKRSYRNLLNAVEGQIRSLQDKANEVEDKNVRKTLDRIDNKLDDMGDYALKNFFSDLSDRCYERGQKFQDKIDYWTEKLDKGEDVDFEKKYQEIQDEYEQIRHNFNCIQCGSPIVIDKRYFIPAYVYCPSCQTQNIFKPSSKMVDLDNVSRQLAEQRTEHLLKAYKKEENKEREIYDKIHNLELEKIGYEIDDNTTAVEAVDEKIAALEKKRQEAILNAPLLYRKYVTAKFEEWIKLVPELEEQNRAIYESWLSQIN